MSTDDARAEADAEAFRLAPADDVFPSKNAQAHYRCGFRDGAEWDAGRAERDALAARLAAVEALANEWENNEAYACRDASDCTRCVTYQGVVIRLRAALSAALTDTTKETDR